MRLSISTLGRTLGVLALLATGCSQPAGPAAPPGQVLVSSAKVGSGAGITPQLLEKVCHAEHADSTSTVFSALGPDGDVRRLVVTPSKSIADMGNLVFDMHGALLGHDTGSEVPWDDRAFMAKEHERVSALMGGAHIPNGSEPIRCK